MIARLHARHSSLPAELAPSRKSPPSTRGKELGFLAGTRALVKKAILSLASSPIARRCKRRLFCGMRVRAYAISADHGSRVEPIADDAEHLVFEARWLGLVLGRTHICYMWRQQLDIDELFSGGTWVHPLARGGDLGTRLIRQALRQGRRHFGHEIYVNISANNARSMQSYKNAGARQIQRQDLRHKIESFYKTLCPTHPEQCIFLFEHDRDKAQQAMQHPNSSPSPRNHAQP